MQPRLIIYSKDKFLPVGVKYSDLLNKKELRSLDSVLQKLWGINANDTKLRPNSLYDVIFRQIAKDKLRGFSLDSFPKNSIFHFLARLNGNVPMDIFLINKAKEKGYKIRGLESIEFQMRLKFQPDMSLALEAKSLVAKLQNQDSLKTVLGSVTDSYFEQDLNGCIDKMNLATRLSGLGDSYADGSIDEVKKRNLNWMPIIELEIENAKSMIAVGVGHLPGEYGLINLLRQAGYQLECVK